MIALTASTSLDLARAPQAEVVDEDRRARPRAPTSQPSSSSASSPMFSRMGRLADSGSCLAEAVDAQAQRARVGLDRPVQAHGERVGRVERLDDGDVAHRRARRDACRGRPRGRPGRSGAGAGWRAPRRAPATRASFRSSSQRRVACTISASMAAHVHGRLVRGCVRTSMWMRASTASVSCTVYSTLVPESRRLQDLLDAHAHVGVEVLARQVDEAGEEAPVEVAAQEEARAAPVAQAQHAHGDLVERGLVDLEELVARDRRAASRAGSCSRGSRREARAVEDARHLAAQQRDVARVGVVGRARVQADEAPLAGHPPRGVEFLHADVVEVARPVHRGARVGLGEHEQARLAGQRADRRRQLAEALRHRRPSRGSRSTPRPEPGTIRSWSSPPSAASS